MFNPTYELAANMAATATVVPKSESESRVFPFHVILRLSVHTYAIKAFQYQSTMQPLRKAREGNSPDKE